MVRPIPATGGRITMFVFVYTIVIITTQIVGGLALHGKPKDSPNHSFGNAMFSLIAILPLIGRVFEWW